MRAVPRVVNFYGTNDLITRKKQQSDIGIAPVKCFDWCESAVACEGTVYHVGIREPILVSAGTLKECSLHNEP
jgi:hypothetical protein